MKKSFVLAVAALGVASGARADILLSFVGSNPAGGGEWTYAYEVQLTGGNLNPNDPYYDSGLFTLFDIQGFVPGSALWSSYGSGTFSLVTGDIDGQGDLPDIQGSYDGVYEIADGDFIGEVSFRSTVSSTVLSTYDSYNDSEGIPTFVDGARIEVPGGYVPPAPVPETSTVISTSVLGLLGAGYVIRRRRAASVAKA